MCQAVTCSVCGKTTWAGCGHHVEEVKRTVPAANWCPGHESETVPANGTDQQPGFLARLFRR